MHTGHSLEILEKRVETLTIYRESTLLSKAHLLCIEKKFADKSLSELTEIARALGTPLQPWNKV
jgi:hypothetical protein